MRDCSCFAAYHVWHRSWIYKGIWALGAAVSQGSSNIEVDWLFRYTAVPFFSTNPASLHTKGYETPTERFHCRLAWKYVMTVSDEFSHFTRTLLHGLVTLLLLRFPSL